MNRTLVARRIDRMKRLAVAHPGRFCWPDLFSGATGGTYPGWLRDAQGAIEDCQRDADTNGVCYCGALQKGGITL